MQGTRPKQYRPLLGRPVILHTLERLTAHAWVEGVLVGIAPHDPYWSTVKGELPRLPKVLGTFDGGAERGDTVLNGLNALAARAGGNDWVLVHDAARPCLRRRDLDSLIAEAYGYPDGGLLAVAVSDTVKRTDSTRKVVETLPRENIWRAVTPQLFPLSRLKAALEQAKKRGLSVTDEAAAIERAGGRPLVVPGHADNIKITVDDDMALAELYLKQQAQTRA
jgi:2-C-methyl-D-erythritol 4-phosphate cytidylyltransferase